MPGAGDDNDDDDELLRRLSALGFLNDNGDVDYENNDGDYDDDDDDDSFVELDPKVQQELDRRSPRCRVLDIIKMMKTRTRRLQRYLFHRQVTK